MSTCLFRFFEMIVNIERQSIIPPASIVDMVDRLTEKPMQLIDSIRVTFGKLKHFHAICQETCVDRTSGKTAQVLRKLLVIPLTTRRYSAERNFCKNNLADNYIRIKDSYLLNYASS